MNFESPAVFSPKEKESLEPRESFLGRKVGITRKVLKQLVFWGFLSIAALEGSSLAEADIAVKPVGFGPRQGMAENIKKTNLQKAKRLEEGLKEKAQRREAKSEKPVIAIVAKSDLERFDDKNIPRRTLESYTRERLITQAVQESEKRFAFVDRSENTMRAIEDEINLTTQSSDLFNPETIAQPKHLNPDYYIVVSEEEDGDSVTLEIEIINMKDGSIKKITTSKDVKRLESGGISEDEIGIAKDVVSEISEKLRRL